MTMFTTSDGMAHIDEFELNMDMAEGWVGAPDYSLDEKVLGPRFDSPPWSLLYLKHQHDGPFWRDRVRPLSEITTPTFLIGVSGTAIATTSPTC